MIRIQPWMEEIWYMECPNDACSHLTELGSGVQFDNEPEKQKCPQCGTEFELVPPTP